MRWTPSRRVTADQHRGRAARFRRLALETTTVRARKHLLDMARQCDARAEGGEDGPDPYGPNVAA
jgi:hypothetical protein